MSLAKINTQSFPIKSRVAQLFRDDVAVANGIWGVKLEVKKGNVVNEININSLIGPAKERYRNTQRPILEYDRLWNAQIITVNLGGQMIELMPESRFQVGILPQVERIFDQNTYLRAA